MRLPVDKGLILRRVHDMAGFARFLRDRGFRFVMPFDATPIGQLDRYIDDCKREGLGVYPMAYIHVDRWQAEVDHLITAAVQAGAHGIVLNCEVSWKGRQPVAASMMAHVKRVYTGAVGIASYPVPRFHDTMPWSTFASGAHFAMPLLFDRHDDYDRDLPAEGIGEWRARGFRRIVPGLGAYHMISQSEFRAKTAAELERHVKMIPAVRGGAFFSLPDFQQEPERFAAQWDVLAGYDPTKAPPTTLMVPFGRRLWRLGLP